METRAWWSLGEDVFRIQVITYTKHILISFRVTMNTVFSSSSTSSTRIADINGIRHEILDTGVCDVSPLAAIFESAVTTPGD
jgi:hypothetical protein